MQTIEENGTIRDKEKIQKEIGNNLEKLCMLDVYKAKSIAFSIAGKLEFGGVNDDGTPFYDIKGFNFFSDAVDNVCYFGVVLRIQIRF